MDFTFREKEILVSMMVCKEKAEFQLRQMQRELDKATGKVKQLEAKITRQRQSIAGQNLLWVQTKTALLKEIASLQARLLKGGTSCV